MEEILNKGPTFLKRFFSLMAVLLVLVLPSFLLSTTQEAQAYGTPAGTVIKNSASATYDDGVNSFSATSNEVQTTILAIRRLVISPTDGDSSPGIAVQKNA